MQTPASDPFSAMPPLERASPPQESARPQEQSARFGPDAHALGYGGGAVAAHGPFVPLFLCGLTVAAWFGLQTWLLTEERAALAATHASQQQTVDNAAKLRASLDALAADTQRMADAGNPNARLLVEELRRRGITINPNPPPAPAEAKK